VLAPAPAPAEERPSPLPVVAPSFGSITARVAPPLTADLTPAPPWEDTANLPVPRPSQLSTAAPRWVLAASDGLSRAPQRAALAGGSFVRSAAAPRWAVAGASFVLVAACAVLGLARTPPPKPLGRDVRVAATHDTKTRLTDFTVRTTPRFDRAALRRALDETA